MSLLPCTRREFIRTSTSSAAALYLGGCAVSSDGGAWTTADQVRDGSLSSPVDRTSWPELARLAIARLNKAGCSYGDIRLMESRNQTIRAADQRISNVSDHFDGGFGIRALYKGAWGFAASASIEPAEIERVADYAVHIARASHLLMKIPVKLADEPIHVDKVVTPRKTDPFAVSMENKCQLLVQVSDTLHKQKGIIRSTGFMWMQQDYKHFASTQGSAIDFDLLAVGGEFSATAKGQDDFQSRHFRIPFYRAGYEHVLGFDMPAHAERIAAQAVEKVAARQPSPGEYDLVLDPGHLALTIHESCGHPTELDRALGYEANFAGTSFLTPEKLGTYQYGSKHVNLIADNTKSGQMASTGYDDDGVAGQRWPIVEAGVFRGYSTSREVASAIGETRSRGSCRADSWASVPIVRIANISLEPGHETLDSLFDGIKNGIYIEDRGTYSIDQKRYNFQFGGDAFWEIKNGKRGSMLKNVVYHGITPTFWGSCDGVADRDHWREYGFISCGKGQPGQSGWMTHSASPARFRGVSVIDSKA